MFLADVNTILRATCAGDIFTKTTNVNDIKAQYRAYARKYHPDIFHRTDVMTKINTLYNNAVTLVEKGIWEEKNVIYIVENNGRKFKFKYIVEDNFEFGKRYIGNNSLIYIFEKQFEKYFNNMLDAFDRIIYKDKKMKEYFHNVIPTVIRYGKMNNDKMFIVMKKEQGIYPLSYVLKYFHGSISPRHTAWITTRLCNIVCFLNICGLVHNGIVIDNLFICPETHTMYLFGGWWYTTRINKRMIGVPADVYKIMPPSTKKKKLADITVDIECVKDVCKRILNKDNVRQIGCIKEWYNAGSNNDPFDNLSKWDRALDRQFGARRFIKMEVNANVVYSK